MKRTFILIVISALFVLPLYSQTLKWYSPDAGFKKAKKEKKTVLIDIYTDWCGWCKKMDNETYSNKKVIKALNKSFVCIKYNPETDGNINIGGKSYTPSKFSSMAKVEGYPATAFFTGSGNYIETVVGFMDRDYILKDVIPKILRR